MRMCKTNLEINEQGYMAVKLFIYATVVAQQQLQIYNWQASYMQLCQMFVKEADGIVPYLKPSTEIVGGLQKFQEPANYAYFLPISQLCFAAVLKILTYYAQNYAHFISLC